MRIPLLLALFVLETHSFVSHNSQHVSRRAFVAHPQRMTTIRSQDECELPDEVPESSASTSDAASTSFPVMSETRRRRLQQEASMKQKFVSGDDLFQLRKHALSLREELQQARLLKATRRIQELEQAILKIQQVDAEFVYTVNLERMYMAEAEGRTEDYERYHEQAMEARSALPQHNLDGLWVGK